MWLLAAAAAFTLPSSAPPAPRARAEPPATRRDALHLALAAAGLLVLPAAQPAFAEEVTTKAGVKIPYTVLKTGSAGGGQPKIGDLVAIRFKGSVKATGSVFDDILTSPEPYYMRLGRCRTHWFMLQA